jgi:4-amino-4-deoxy-L-arabinose transferase-like glycosyltransferase
MYVSMGLGTLTMGPVNMVMPAIVIVFYLLVVKDIKQIFRLRLGWGILIYLVIVLPWYLLVSLKGDYAGNILVTTNLTRFFTAWGHVRPFYYYIVTFPGNFLPWTLFLPGAIILCSSQKVRDERKKLLFPIIWAVSLFLFFSLSQCKRSEYILPLYPALALLLGFFFHKSIDWWDNSAVWRRWILWPTYLLAALLFITAVGLPIYCMIKSPDWTGTVIPLSLIMVVLVIPIIVLIRKEQVFLTVVAIGVLLAGMVVYASGPIFSKANAYKSTRSFCLRVKARIREDTTLKMYGYYRPAYAFYTDRFVECSEDPETLLAWFTAEAPEYVVMKRKDFARIKDAFPLTLHLIDEWEGYRHMVLVSNQSETDV